MAEEKFLGDPMLDRVMKVVMALARELYVTQDRLRVIERLLETKGRLTRADIDGYVPDPATAAEILEARDAFVDRLLRPAIGNPDP